MERELLLRDGSGQLALPSVLKQRCRIGIRSADVNQDRTWDRQRVIGAGDQMAPQAASSQRWKRDGCEQSAPVTLEVCAHHQQMVLQVRGAVGDG